jgi:hypothetical protein
MKVSNNRIDSFMDMEKRAGGLGDLYEFGALRHCNEAYMNISI